MSDTRDLVEQRDTRRKAAGMTDTRETHDYRPLGVGDLVRVLRACRLPVEDVLGVGQIERVSRSESGERLYWVRGFPVARTERELRRTRTMADVWAEHEAEQDEAIR